MDFYQVQCLTQVSFIVQTLIDWVIIIFLEWLKIFKVESQVDDHQTQILQMVRWATALESELI